MLCQLSYCPPEPFPRCSRGPAIRSQGARKHWWKATKQESLLRITTRVERLQPVSEPEKCGDDQRHAAENGNQEQAPGIVGEQWLTEGGTWHWESSFPAEVWL
jgi:hypothetical protein